MKQPAYQQFLRFLDDLTEVKKVLVPTKGWIRAIRNGLGMSIRQLAARMKVSASRIQRLEKDELVGAVTIRSMRRAAEAMDCVFVYAILPKDDLGSILKRQAQLKANEHMKRISHTMGLEAQSLDSEINEEMFKTLVQNLIDEKGSKLWDTP